MAQNNKIIEENAIIEDHARLEENRPIPTGVQEQHTAEVVVFHSEGLEIHGLLRQAKSPGTLAVIFCHGAFEFQDNWLDYAERLNATGYATFTFDFAGHGESGGVPSLVNLRVWAYNIRDALNYLQTRGYSKFALVGWGSGGSAALLAAAHDKRLACAVILSTPVQLQPPVSERIAYGLATVAAKVKQALLKKPLTLSRLNELKELRMLSDESANAEFFSNPRLQDIYKAIPIPDSLDSVWIDITSAIRKVTIPVLLIHGSEDRMVPVQQSQKLFDLLQGPKDLKLVNGSGHAVHLDRDKDAVYTMIVKWIKKYLK